MNRRTYRNRWLLNHAKYEKKGLAIFRKRFRETSFKIPFESVTENNYEILTSLNILEQDIRQSYFDFYLQTGLRHGKKIGRAIQKELNQEKNFSPDTFENEYRQVLSSWLINNAGERITGVTNELREYIIKFIAQGLEDGKDIKTISRELQKHIKSRSFYKWQIERIVRTETTAAANFGAIQAGESSRIVWEKEWVSSRDARTRRRPDDQFDHYDIDGMRVPKEEKFNVQGDLLEYPGDPKGNPSNTINCRCTVAIVPKRDANGRLIRTSNSSFQFNN